MLVSNTAFYLKNTQFDIFFICSIIGKFKFEI